MNLPSADLQEDMNGMNPRGSTGHRCRKRAAVGLVSVALEVACPIATDQEQMLFGAWPE